MKTVSRSKILITLLILSSLLAYYFLKENKKGLNENLFIPSKLSAREIRNNIIQSNSSCKISLEINCGNGFMEDTDELYLSLKNGFVPFKAGIVEFEYYSSNSTIELAPILFLIRNNKVYVKYVKENFPLYKKINKYKIELCDFNNRIVPIR